jgi:uncharacterized protein involved in propanediol utilization
VILELRQRHDAIGLVVAQTGEEVGLVVEQTAPTILCPLPG